MQNIGSLSAGTYTLTVTDHNGCTASTSSVINTQPSLYTVSATATAITCNGFGNGSIAVTPNGGTGSSTYSWTGPSSFASTSGNISSLNGGTYVLSATDANGCTASTSALVTDPPAIDNGGNTVTNINCKGDATGAISITPIGGTGTKTFSWTGPNSFASTLQNISSLSVGSYVITITDANSCSYTETISVTEPLLALSVSSTPSQILCYGGTGSISSSPVGGTGARTYSWTGPGSYTSTLQNIGSLSAGTYTLTVTDHNGCTASTSSVINTQPTLYTVSASHTNVTCYTYDDGTISITPNGGTGSSSYSWTGPNSYSSNSGNISSLAPGTYVVSATDANGCPASTSAVITQPDAWQPIISGNQGVCAGNTSSFCVVSNGTTSGFSGSTYQWIILGGTITSGANTNCITVTWNANCTNGVVRVIETRHPSGCIMMSTDFNVYIHSLPTPVISGNTTVLNPSTEQYSTACIPGHKYSWAVVGGTITSTTNSCTITVDWGSCGSCTTGSVTVTETNEDSCSASASINVTINQGTASIFGQLTYNNSIHTPLNGVTVNLYQGSTLIASTVTATAIDESVDPPTYTAGAYRFDNLSTGAKTAGYTLRLASTKPWGGVTAADALLIKLHTTGTYLTNLPLVAANVNLSGGSFPVNSTDALLVQLRIVGLVSSFTAGDWVFGNNPFTNSGNIPVTTGATAKNLIALATGDVNGSYIPTTGAKSIAYTNLQKDGIILANNSQEIEVPVRVNDVLSLGAVTLDMNYNKNLVEVTGLTSQLNDLKYNIVNGKVLVAWADVNPVSLQANDVLFTLKVRVKDAIKSNTDLFSYGDNTEFADGNGQTVQFSSLKVSSIQTDANNNSISVYPNPFKGNAEINYNLVSSGSVRITLYNALGQRINVLVDEYKDAGNYKFNLNTSDLPSGVYSCEIIVNGETSKYNKVIKLVKAN